MARIQLTHSFMTKHSGIDVGSSHQPAGGAVPLISFPKPMEEVTVWPLLPDFSFMMSSSLETSSVAIFFFFFFLLRRGGSFLGKVNMGKMTRSMAMAQSRKPLHLCGTKRETHTACQTQEQ